MTIAISDFINEFVRAQHVVDQLSWATALDCKLEREEGKEEWENTSDECEFCFIIEFCNLKKSLVYFPEGTIT